MRNAKKSCLRSLHVSDCFVILVHLVVLFRDSLLPALKMGLEPRREKRESCITCKRMLGTTPFFPPKLGEKPYLERDS